MSWFPGNWWGGGSSSGGGGGGPVFPALTNATTADAIRDRGLDLVEAIVPTYLPSLRFRRYRNEDGDFIAWSQANPESCFRRLQIRFDGINPTPMVSNTDFEERPVRLTTFVAYPNNGRTGAKQTLDRDTAIDRDYDQIEKAIGLYSRANFSAPYPDAVWAEGDCTRVEQGPCTFLLVTGVFHFRRTTS